MKFRKLVLSPLILLAVALLPAIAYGDQNVVIKSKNSEFQISLPSTWGNAATIIDDPLSQITAADNTHNSFLVVDSKHSADFTGDFLPAAQRMRDGFVSKLQDATTGDGKEFQINSWDCVQYEVHGTMTKEQFKGGFVMTCIKTDKHIFLVLSCCGDSDFDQNADALRQIPNGLTELDPSSDSASGN